MKQRRKIVHRALVAEGLEERRVLAVSVGWDGPGTGSAQLSYYIGQAPNGMSEVTFESAIETALKSWSDVAAIKFVQTTQPGLNNALDFTSKRIDGSGGTLAQAYFPSDVNRGRIAGDVEFDSMEKWEVGNSLGNAAFDLVWVAVHEIGHALGLDHSNNPSAVLYPSVSPSQSFQGLSSADISAVRSVYAAAPGSTNTNPTNTGTTNTNVTNTWTTRTPRFTFNSWFANWFSRFGRLNSEFQQLDSTIPAGQGREDFGRGEFGFRMPRAFGGWLTPERVDRLFEKYDDNADELPTEDEVPRRLWTRWVEGAVDTNDDSSVSVAELNAAVRAKQQKRFDSLDADSDGLLKETEAACDIEMKRT